jgi:hypothetical protein
MLQTSECLPRDSSLRTRHEILTERCGGIWGAHAPSRAALGALAKRILKEVRRTEGFRRERRKSEPDWQLRATRVHSLDNIPAAR